LTKANVHVLANGSINNVCAPISVSVGIMQWNSEFSYLGVTVFANNKFKSSFLESRRTFLGFFNAIYGRIGNKNHISTTLSLLNSMYACSSLWS